MSDDDIVARLRDYADNEAIYPDLLCNAADEITRLRRFKENTEKQLQEAYGQIGALLEEPNKLRADLAAAREALKEARMYVSGKAEPWANLTPVLARIDAALKGNTE